jgi:hypothetical protein
MRDTLIVAATVDACALIGNVVGGYVVASRLSHLVAAPAAAARAAPATSADIAYSRLMGDPPPEPQLRRRPRGPRPRPDRRRRRLFRRRERRCGRRFGPRDMSGSALPTGIAR